MKLTDEPIGTRQDEKEQDFFAGLLSLVLLVGLIALCILADNIDFAWKF